MSQWAFGYLLTPIPGLGGDQFLDEQAQSEYRDYLNKRLIQTSFILGIAGAGLWF